jgi:tetratricopeptide (TPR) repeat protein
VRSVPLVLSILICGRIFAVAAVDVSDLGVEKGWTPNQYNDRGNYFLDKKDYKNAERYYTAALRGRPDEWVGYYNRACAFIGLKNGPAALQDLNTTIRLQPAFFQASYLREIINKRLHNYAASLRDLNALLKGTFDVQNAEEFAAMLNDRAWLQSTCTDASLRNGRQAVKDAKRACQLSKWSWSNYIETLAAASAEVGDFDSAVRYQEQAINLRNAEHNRNVNDMAKLKQKHHGQKDEKEVGKFAEMLAKEDKTLIQDFTKRLELYKQHQPYRDTR